MLLYLWRETGERATAGSGDASMARCCWREAAKEDTGWSWKTTEAARNLTGFSHGAAGIGWALAELYAASREGGFRAAALEAFRYERSCWNPGKRNWPDFREDEPEYPVHWCHGATGIGLSRLRTWQILGDPELLAEAHSALATVREDMGSPDKLFALPRGNGERGFTDLRRAGARRRDLAHTGSSYCAGRLRTIRAPPRALALWFTKCERDSRPDAGAGRHRAFLFARGRSKRLPRFCCRRAQAASLMPHSARHNRCKNWRAGNPAPGSPLGVPLWGRLRPPEKAAAAKIGRPPKGFRRCPAMPRDIMAAHIKTFFVCLTALMLAPAAIPGATTSGAPEARQAAA